MIQILIYVFWTTPENRWWFYRRIWWKNFVVKIAALSFGVVGILKEYLLCISPLCCALKSEKMSKKFVKSFFTKKNLQKVEFNDTSTLYKIKVFLIIIEWSSPQRARLMEKVKSTCRFWPLIFFCENWFHEFLRLFRGKSYK